jgi:hypothetical protein
MSRNFFNKPLAKNFWGKRLISDSEMFHVWSVIPPTPISWSIGHWVWAPSDIAHSSSFQGGGVNRFSDRRISQKKLFGFRIWRIFYTDFRILLIQRIADLSNILARIVDLACNLVRILDCDFIQLLADSNLDKPLSDREFCFKFGWIGGFV